ncbi:MAG: 4Fe-4S binding protein, partial [Clostridia bacterium]|nr:4Fe-4S binding protein [Clostridia bacterium]
KIVLITDSSRKKMKRAAEEALHGDPAVSVAEVAVRYPCLESTLLSAIYNTAPNSKHPEMFFVSGPSAAAVFRGLVTGFPHTEQTITASGKGFGNPCVLRVPIGTTWKTILRFCKHKGGAYLTKTGSPLTGEPASGICRVNQDRVFSFTEQPGDPSPCISCGKCASVCPVGLYPFLIHRTRNYRHVKSMSSACIGCGCCAFACPSHIPLNELIRKYANKEDADHV